MRGLFAAGQQQMQHHLQYSGAARQHSIIRHNVVCKSSHQQSAPVTQQQQQQQQFVDLCLPPELQGFRPNVGMCVFHPQTHQVFAATRLDDPGKSWQMPQGGIDEGEAPQDAALRELFEETCISSVEVVAEIPRWLPYEFPTSVRCKLKGTWANYKGQAQRWFLLRFTGDEAEINLDTDHREFDGWRWMPLEQLPDTVISFKQGVYREVVAEFQPVLELLKTQRAGK